MTHQFIIAADTPDAEEFAQWLNERGHTASVGDSDGNYVDGNWTSGNADADEVMNAMWDAFCNE